MGYAGYTAAKLPPPKATGLQAALWSIESMECLEVQIQKLCPVLLRHQALQRHNRFCLLVCLHCCNSFRTGVAVQVMSKLARNTAVSPTEDKFKRIKLSNSKVKTAIVDSTGGIPSLLAMGWTYDEADKDFLMLPKGTQITMKEVSANLSCVPMQHLSVQSGRM